MFTQRGTAVYDDRGMLFVPDSLVADAGTADDDRDRFVLRLVREMTASPVQGK